MTEKEQISIHAELKYLHEEIIRLREIYSREDGQIGSTFQTIAKLQERQDELAAQITDHESTPLTRAHR